MLLVILLITEININGLKTNLYLVGKFEFWLAALREPELSLRNRAGDQGWQGAFRTVLSDGIADGSFAPDGTPEQVATKLVTLLDGTMLRRMLGSQGADDDLDWAVAQFVRPAVMSLPPRGD